MEHGPVTITLYLSKRLNLLKILIFKANMRMPLCLSLCINVHSCVSDTKFLFIVQLEFEGCCL